jgi:hypothetical protein
MRQVWSFALCLSLAVSSLVAALGLFPGLAAAVGLDFWNVPATLDAMGEGMELDRRLDEEVRAARRRIAAKDEVAREAAEGRLTLREAAARFRDLDADAPEAYRRGWCCVPGAASDEERYCRQVLGHAAVAARGRPGQAAALRRLEAQLDRARADLSPPG